MKKKYIVLLIIVLLASCLRLIGLESNPPSLTWDEVAWGYNAYSLSIDGKDEFGRFLPLDYFESFGDFKPPVYAYLGVLPVLLFGLTEFAVRFPSAILGVMTVLLTYFLVKEMFFTSRNKEWYGFLSAGILAISPWHILLSRAAFEANVATFFIVLGVLLFLKSLHTKPWYIVLSAIAFVLSMHTFNTARIVAPLLVLGFALFTFRKLFSMKKWFALGIVIGLILLAPAIPFLLSPQARLRYQEVNIFSNIQIIERTNQEIVNAGNTPIAKVLHNRRIAYTIEYLKHYLDHFTPQFLFLSGDGNPKFSVQNVGQMYLWELPFFVMGALFLFRKREGYWWMIPLWLMIGIIPAATARETPHALRIETTLPTFQIIIAYGVVSVYSFLRKYLVSRRLYIRKITVSMKPFYYILTSLYLLLILFNVTYFIHGYFVHYPREYSSEWQYGYKEAITYVKSIAKEYDAVYVTAELGRPYAYFLFYLITPPEEFRTTAIIRRSPFGFVDVDGFGKYRFVSDMNHSPTVSSGKALYIHRPSQTPENAKILKSVVLVNGETVLNIYTL